MNSETNACKIFGPNLADVREKTVRRKSERVKMDYVAIPKYFYSLNRYVTLTADMMFVNDNSFLVTSVNGPT